jgi:hypothetical protein
MSQGHMMTTMEAMTFMKDIWSEIEGEMPSPFDTLNAQVLDLILKALGLHINFSIHGKFVELVDDEGTIAARLELGEMFPGHPGA